MLRIHFTSDDLARISLADAADPLWETVLSRFRLHEPHVGPAFRPWVRRIRTSPALAARMRPGARVLAALAPLGSYFPDFLTPLAGRCEVEAGLDAIMSTPRRRLRDELCRLARHSPVPGWARPLADGDPVALSRLGEALRSYHEAAVAPHRDLIGSGVDADRARRAHALLNGGIDGLFATMHPAMRWQAPLLDVDYCVDQELHLAGRGLRLIPSFFCQGTPVSLADPGLPPVLVYSLDQDLRWSHLGAGEPGALDELLGRTRAAVLREIDAGATTTRLARRLRISAASASRHTKVLRDAGLIASHRAGPAVLHTVTSLGRRLRENQPGPR
ncbi:winged helix-turn-helix domain-containing protein [Amycolatopsis sp. NBC_01488]|uniref:winged helix-turn-helix domain-containing protein n=1 Tax=Amycolatopsis sp. NBC_01488 TaxID=2903563 RepID=UPI002E2C71D0|nr:winged helix-turn-helix domain-containing protein [Amycolatopsis sp. NBC_01488]